MSTNELITLPDPQEVLDLCPENVFALDGSPFNLPLRISSFASEKEVIEFVKCVERLVRHSNEYRLWVNYITETLGQSKCALTEENISECPLQVHHHPINLYTIIKTVINDCLKKKLLFSTFDIACKVMELHYQNKVGYVVILSDLHCKFHNGFLNLPIELVQGDYKHILTHYSIEENEYDKICSYCNIHISDMKQSWKKDFYPGLACKED